jgi:hypothetical protein
MAYMQKIIDANDIRDDDAHILVGIDTQVKTTGDDGQLYDTYDERFETPALSGIFTVAG